MSSLFSPKENDNKNCGMFGTKQNYQEEQKSLFFSFQGDKRDSNNIFSNIFSNKINLGINQNNNIDTIKENEKRNNKLNDNKKNIIKCNHENNFISYCLENTEKEGELICYDCLYKYYIDHV